MSTCTPWYGRGPGGGVEAALGLGELERAASLLLERRRDVPAEAVAVPRSPCGSRPRAPTGGSRWRGSRLGYRQAAGRFRELGIPFWLAVTLLRPRGARGDADGPAFAAEARETFDALGATPWVARADVLVARPAEVA